MTVGVVGQGMAPVGVGRIPVTELVQTLNLVQGKDLGSVAGLLVSRELVQTPSFFEPAD